MRKRISQIVRIFIRQKLSEYINFLAIGLDESEIGRWNYVVNFHPEREGKCISIAEYHG